MSDELGRHTSQCPECGGKGRRMALSIYEGPSIVCPTCKGKGFLTEEDVDREE